MFVILSAWRYTSYALPVEERMGQTFKTAAISITVTSVTDALAFLIGSVSNFRAVSNNIYNIICLCGGSKEKWLNSFV